MFWYLTMIHCSIAAKPLGIRTFFVFFCYRHCACFFPLWNLSIILLCCLSWNLASAWCLSCVCVCSFKHAVKICLCMQSKVTVTILFVTATKEKMGHGTWERWLWMSGERGVRLSLDPSTFILYTTIPSVCVLTPNGETMKCSFLESPMFCSLTLGLLSHKTTPLSPLFHVTYIFPLKEYVQLN